MKDQQLSSINVSVTPTGQTGSEVECDIAGSEVVDDALFLGKDKTCDITFTLDAGAAETWDQRNPFCARNGKCPSVNAPAHGLFTVKNVSPKSLTVEAKAPNRRSVVHYRLNFAGGGTCDPVIIRD